MGKYKYSKTEQQINDVLKYHDDELKNSKRRDLLHLNLTEEYRKVKIYFGCWGIRKCRQYQSEKNRSK